MFCRLPSTRVSASSIFTILVLLLSACDIPYDEDSFSLKATARGLATNESITVFNGSNVEISGNADLSWTEPQPFKLTYKESSPKYTVRITRQPSNSNKRCRVLNPNGTASKSSGLIRIECGYPIAVINSNETITKGSGLQISNGLQSLRIESNTFLVTSLKHEVINDPFSGDPDLKVLEVIPEFTIGTVFEELYLEGDPVYISFSSVSQGCEIAGAGNNSSLNFLIPESGSFADTVQTIPLDQDWIDSSSSFGKGRTCNDFSPGRTYLLDYDALENSTGENIYSATCFPMEPVEINCGYALQVKVRGLDENLGETVRLTATRTRASDFGTVAHTVELSQNFTSGSNINRGRKTFNLAFENSDNYEITVDDSSGLVCSFDRSGTDTAAYDFGGAENVITEVLRCQLP